MGTDELVLSQAQELRRGTVVLACLALLEEPRYGYALVETLGDAGIAVDGNTLYPLLRRLEKQGLLIQCREVKGRLAVSRVDAMQEGPLLSRGSTKI
ncbi:PadR family transcriptional regulator, partial [Streptomyces sp. NPDC048155]|uniref:PadR family transcriptional regulator n=1 Tax=Streptomyces sp. NPDC048155 TaxID=3154818 RepID=UPI0033D22979